MAVSAAAAAAAGVERAVFKAPRSRSRSLCREAAPYLTAHQALCHPWPDIIFGRSCAATMLYVLELEDEVAATRLRSNIRSAHVLLLACSISLPPSCHYRTMYNRVYEEVATAPLALRFAGAIPV